VEQQDAIVGDEGHRILRGAERGMVS
jgi:hypothetical protein